MRTRSAVGVLLALLVAGSALVMASPAQALTGTPLDCDGVVAVPGGYLLTHDTDCTISWNESDKSFDLDGHTFTGQLRLQGDRVVVVPLSSSALLTPWRSQIAKILEDNIYARIDSYRSSVNFRIAAISTSNEDVIADLFLVRR